MTSLRSRRLLAALSLLLALAATGCSGGDSTPDDPAEDAGAGVPAQPGQDDPSLNGGAEQDPPEGVNQPLPDPGDDLEEPSP